MQNATEELKRLEEAFNAVRQGIFTQLHEVVRDQIFVPGGGALNSSPSAEEARDTHTGNGARHLSNGAESKSNREVSGSVKVSRE